MLVAVEGIDKAGKSTLARKLQHRLSNAILTEEPQSDTKTGKLCRYLLKRYSNHELDALAFALDRVDHYNRIKKILEIEDAIVITDRYKMSSLAYQSVQGVDLEWLTQINSKVPEPDLTIYIDIPVDVAISRMSDKKFVNKEFLQKVKNQYQILLLEYDHPVLIIKHDDDKMVDKILSFIKLFEPSK